MAASGENSVTLDSHRTLTGPVPGEVALGLPNVTGSTPEQARLAGSIRGPPRSRSPSISAMAISQGREGG